MLIKSWELICISSRQGRREEGGQRGGVEGEARLEGTERTDPRSATTEEPVGSVTEKPKEREETVGEGSEGITKQNRTVDTMRHDTQERGEDDTREIGGLTAEEVGTGNGKGEEEEGSECPSVESVEDDELDEVLLNCCRTDIMKLAGREH